MSANFYNSYGVMIGGDVHGDPAMGASPYFYVTTIPQFGYWLSTFQWTTTVTTVGQRTMQGSIDWYVVPHVPIPLLGGPNLALIIAESGSKPLLSVSSVTGEGQQLAVCSDGCFGFNVNCWGVGFVSSVPSGQVIQYNTVMTTPSLGDALGALAGVLADNIVAFGVEKTLGKQSPQRKAMIKHLLRRAPDLFDTLGLEDANWVFDFPGKLKKRVQEWVDGGG